MDTTGEQENIDIGRFVEIVMSGVLKMGSKILFVWKSGNAEAVGCIEKSHSSSDTSAKCRTRSKYAHIYPDLASVQTPSFVAPIALS